MAPVLHTFITTLPSLLNSGDSFETRVGASNPLNNAQGITIGLPIITQTLSVSVTETQLMTTTVTSVVPITETVTTTLILSPSRTTTNVFKPVFPSSSTSTTTQSAPSQSSPVPGVPPPSALSDQNRSTLSSGGVVGITLGLMFFTLILVICFIRYRLRRRRLKDRTWVTPFVVEKPAVRPSVNRRQQKRMEYLAERWARIRSLRKCEGLGKRNHGEKARSSAMEGSEDRLAQRRNPRDGGQANTTQPSSVVRPPATHQEQPSARRPVRDSPFVSSLFPHGAVAKLKFDPIRPDELPVSAGDHLRVIALYDDGWALCRNASGRKGMVPTACLRVHEARRIG